jgi:hypothetical protein
MPRTQSTRPVRRQPRPPARQPQPAGGPPRQRNIARNALALVALLLLAAVVAGIVVLTTTSSSDRVDLDNVVKDNLNDQVQSLQQVIQDNTK